MSAGLGHDSYGMTSFSALIFNNGKERPSHHIWRIKMLRRFLEMDSKRRSLLIYMAIIALQLILVLYWANEKSNYFIDELYSKGYASSYTGEGDTVKKFTESPEWSLNEWVNNASFKKYLLVEEDEQLFKLPFFRAMRKLLTGKNYFGLLNIAESIAGYSIVSIRPGIVLNMIIFIAAEIALLVFMRKMKMDIRSQYLALAMFGFSGHGIGLVVFIRFYVLIIMYLLWLLTLFYGVWNSNSFKKIIPAELGILGLTYLSYKNSQLTMIFFGAFSFCFVIALIISGKWKPLISYMVMGLCGVVYIWVRTDYINILLHPTDYPESMKAVVASLSIASFQMDLTKTNVLNSMKFLGSSYFGDYLIILMAAVALTIYSLWIRRRKMNDELLIIPYIFKPRPDTLIAIAAWIGLLGFSFCTNRGVIICVGSVCILLLRFLYELTGRKIRLQNFLSPESRFVCVLLGTAIIYTLVIAMADLTVERYFCFASVLFYIVFWYLLDRILAKRIRRELFLGWYIILAASVALSTLVPFKTRDIPYAYIYEDDRSFISALEPYRDMDVVLAAYVYNLGWISRMEIYDCVNLMSENSNIYAVGVIEYFFDEEKFTDEFVLWARNDQDILPILDDLAEHGYEFESLGQNHISQAYVCRINRE